MSDISDHDAGVLKAASRMIAETLNADTVVILAQRGDDKLMQAGGDRGSAAALVLDGAKQVAKELAHLFREHQSTPPAQP